MSAAHPLSVQCSATSKATQQRCRRWVIGGGVCPVHGGKAPQVAAAREARIATHEAAQRQDPLEVRDPGDALLAAAQTADQLMQQIQRELSDQGTLTPALVVALGDWLDRSGRLNKTVLDARIDERRTRLSQAEGAQLLQILRGVLTELGHDLSPGSEAAQVVLRHIEPLRANPLRVIEGGAS